MSRFNINKDIHLSATLPSEFYRSKTIFEESKEKIFASTWQYVADTSVVEQTNAVYPFTFLEGVLDEPLLLSRDKKEEVHCLSNVCTHRGKIIVEKPGVVRRLSCGYHGRCFHLDGRFKSMPEFEAAENFPSSADDLTVIGLEELFGMQFISLDPKMSFKEVVAPIQERMSFLPKMPWKYDAGSSMTYEVKGNWALYCDNFLEGFHIPFVHPALNEAIDFGQYSYEIYPYANLQLGIAEEGQPCFDLPPDAKDYGQKVYAYYWWVFPNLMLNFYPWGLSMNYVQPLSADTTRVEFRTYKYAENLGSPVSNALDQTEMEDEAVVESVQLGIQSRFYKSGRFSPTMEKGVHHFHQLVDVFMSGEK